MENKTETAIIKKETSELMSIPVSEITNQIQAIQQMMKDVMIEGMDGHYGKVPGCGEKKVLLKAGAEKLVLLFRFAPTYKVKTVAFPDNPGHREYSIKCILLNINTGKLWAEGLGSCSTMESRYRYRDDSKLIETGNPVPKTYWDSKDIKMIGGPGHIAKKDESGRWMIYVKESSGKIENPDIADTYNTVLKIAKKRALVDAVITATATSDIFTQDLDENFQVETTATKTKQISDYDQLPMTETLKQIGTPILTQPSENIKQQPVKQLTPGEKKELDLMCEILAKDAKMSIKDWKNENIRGIAFEIAVETVKRLYDEHNKKF
jgi:hypothetical protein